MPATRPRPREVLAEIQRLNRLLIQWSFADRQREHRIVTLSGGIVRIEPVGGLASAAALKNVSYPEMYSHQRAEQSYSFLMLDGALVQLQYEYVDGEIRRHRLAFLPSPDLAEYQNEPELYDEDPMFAEVVERRVVAVPLRFDYDASPGVAKDVEHPMSHLTLGQYTRCRIPVAGPVTPFAFLSFVLRHFYNTAHAQVGPAVPTSTNLFPSSITTAERLLLHMSGPMSN